MKTIHLPLLVILAAIPLNTPAQTNSQGQAPGVTLSQTAHLQATVEDIDYARREVTLKGPEGNSVRLAVGDSVKNFPQMKKGDHVNIAYYESVALAVAKPGEDLQPTSRTDALATRKPGQRPGGAAVSTVETTATIEDIDRENREVTLKGMDGNTVKVKVDPSVGNLQRIKEGDTIKATITQALAISVDDPDSKSRGADSESK
jgi:hypothetical protein